MVELSSQRSVVVVVMGMGKVRISVQDGPSVDLPTSVDLVETFEGGQPYFSFLAYQS